MTRLVKRSALKILFKLYMIYDILKPRLPLLVYSVGIALVATIIRTQTVDMSQVLSMTLLIFGTLNILKNYAPKVYSQTTSGIGHNTGFQMFGGNPSASAPNNAMTVTMTGR
jgi:hypothetical protein